jgi:hypothetical protein
MAQVNEQVIILANTRGVFGMPNGQQAGNLGQFLALDAIQRD